MQLNHINLPVQDVGNAITLFEGYFGFRCVEVKGDNLIAVLHGADGFILVLMSAAITKQGSTDYPDAFHIGFMLERKEAVTSLHDKLTVGGVDAGREPAKIRDSFGFYFKFEGILIEVGHYE